MLQAIGVLVGDYAIARLLQAPVMVPGDPTTRGHLARQMYVLFTSLIAAAVVGYLTYCVYQSGMKLADTDPLGVRVPQLR